MRLLTCCIGDRRQEKIEAETRHARIVEIYRSATNVVGETPTQSPPPSYNEVVYDSLSGTTVVLDEKTAQAQSPLQTQAQQNHNGTAMSRPSSARTSVCSIPSTRLTDITSAHTGGTIVAYQTHLVDSPRSSLVFDSAPPSYYDGRSIRESSRNRDGQRYSDEQGRHAVMGEEWLERLRRAAANEQGHS